MIKDEEGNDCMIFNEAELKIDTLMGNEIYDFEIVQLLGEGGSGFVQKVRSKNNEKIYAMKEILFEKLKTEREKEMCLNEVKFLEKLSNPHIIKYFKVSSRITVFI